MPGVHEIKRQEIGLNELKEILYSNVTLKLSTDSQKLIEDCRAYLLKVIADGNDAIYGINTGFGDLCNVVIPDEDLGKLQENLLLSHACGLGGGSSG